MVSYGAVSEPDAKWRRLLKIEPLFSRMDDPLYGSRSVVTLPNRVVSVWSTTVTLFVAMMIATALRDAGPKMQADREVVIAAVRREVVEVAGPALTEKQEHRKMADDPLV